MTHVEETFPELDDLARRIDAHTRFADNVYIDATALAERFFADHMPANVIVLGAAYQRGPSSAGEMESRKRPSSSMGLAWKRTERPFLSGGAAVANPEWLGSLELGRTSIMESNGELSAEALALVESSDTSGEVPSTLDPPRPRAHRLPGRRLRAKLREVHPACGADRAGARGRRGRV